MNFGRPSRVHGEAGDEGRDLLRLSAAEVSGQREISHHSGPERERVFARGRSMRCGLRRSTLCRLQWRVLIHPRPRGAMASALSGTLASGVPGCAARNVVLSDDHYGSARSGEHAERLRAALSR